MPYYHCSKCHHEYEGYDNQKCDWCGADNPKVLEEKTPLEKMCDVIRKVGIEKYLKM